MTQLATKVRWLSRKAYWRLKSLLGWSGKTPEEIFYRLSFLSETPGLTGTFQFPWGNIEFTKRGALRSQFAEIYLNRHYACKLHSLEPVIVDCGGNIGMSAIWFRQNYPGCSLTVYEADPELAAILKRNVDRAGYPDTTVRNSAVWIENTQLSFAAKGDETGKIDPAGHTLVTAVDIASALPQKVDLLKLDIEGAEFEVMEHLLKTGAISQVQNLVIEFHPVRKTIGRMLQIIEGLAQVGMKYNFEASLDPWLGLEEEDSPFEIVARNRTFLHLYAWRG